MNKTIKAISIVTVLLLVSRVFGFVREMIIAAYYGATHQTDAYNVAILIIGLSTAFISAGVATVIIPMYNHRLIQRSKHEADSFASNILWITSLFYMVLSITGIIFSSVLVQMFAPSFEADTAALAVHITRITFIFTIPINISNFVISIAQTHHKFAITVISNLPFNVLTIIAIIFFAEELGIYALVISYMLFLLIQPLFLVLSVRKVFNFKAVLNFIDGELKEVFKLSLPVYISVAVWEINMVVDKILASGLPEGSISVIMYASKLRSLPDGIITASIIAVMFPLLSQYAARKEFIKLKRSAVKAVSLLFMAMLPVIAVSVYYAAEITKIVYERGAFTPDMTALTASIFTFAAISLVFSGGAGLLNNLFYSMQDTKTPQVAAVIMVVFNITFNLILIRYMEAAGLALATSIASFVYFIVLFIYFRIKCGAFGGFALLKNIIKYIVAMIGMIPVFFLLEMLRVTLPLLVFFSVATILSLFVYALLLYLLKAELFMETWSQMKAMVKNQVKRIRLKE
jgi:putative peptidoglycan lipid II flippase